MARKRKAGDGTVRQRKDGRWEGRIVIGYDDNGYPKTKNVLAKTKKECVEKLQKLKEECGGLKPEKVRSEMPFGVWLTYWYENHSKPKIRPTTQETYESRIRLHIIPEIGDIPLNKLTQNDLQQFYGRLKKSGRKRFTDKYGEGLSDRMVRMCHATCRSALEKAAQDGLIRVNPAIGCKLPPKKAREMQVLTREELQRFLIQAKFEGYYEVFLLNRCAECEQAGLRCARSAPNQHAQDEELRPKDRPATRCGGGAAGVQRDSRLPLDVSVSREGGLSYHARRGAPQTAAHLGTRGVQACALP